MTYRDLEVFIDRGQRGETLTYHYGSLARDRMPGRPDWKRIEATATLAYAAHRDGKLLLAQRRGGPGRFSYTATHT